MKALWSHGADNHLLEICDAPWNCQPSLQRDFLEALCIWDYALCVGHFIISFT